MNALRLVYSYLTNKKQRTKINTKYSSCEKILFGVPQGSILGALFNIFLCYLFFITNETEFASYTNNNTPYTSGQNIDDVIRTLENDSTRLFKWFTNSQMKANKNKCHYLPSNKERVTVKIGEAKTKTVTAKSYLDSKLTTNLHLINI